MTAKQKLTDARLRIRKQLAGFKVDRRTMIERKATQVELALADDLILACEDRLSEIDLYLSGASMAN